MTGVGQEGLKYWPPDVCSEMSYSTTVLLNNNDVCEGLLPIFRIYLIPVSLCISVITFIQYGDSKWHFGLGVMAVIGHESVHLYQG